MSQKACMWTHNGIQFSIFLYIFFYTKRYSCFTESKVKLSCFYVVVYKWCFLGTLVYRKGRAMNPPSCLHFMTLVCVVKLLIIALPTYVRTYDLLLHVRIDLAYTCQISVILSKFKMKLKILVFKNKYSIYVCLHLRISKARFCW